MIEALKHTLLWMIVVCTFLIDDHPGPHPIGENAFLRGANFAKESSFLETCMCVKSIRKHDCDTILCFFKIGHLFFDWSSSLLSLIKVMILLNFPPVPDPDSKFTHKQEHVQSWHECPFSSFHFLYLTTLFRI